MMKRKSVESPQYFINIYYTKTYIQHHQKMSCYIPKSIKPFILDGLAHL